MGRLKRITYKGLTGGLNLTVPAELIDMNELALAENVEYDASGAGLSVRPGLTRIATLPEPATGLFSLDASTLIAVTETGIYRVENGTATAIGTPTGTGTPSFARFDDALLIATGGRLQSTDGVSVTPIPVSGVLNHAEANISNLSVDVNPDTVFVRAGRAWIAAEGHDMLFASAVGDPADWAFGTDTASAKFIEAGYKDGEDIAAVAAFAGDVIVMKTGGSIYRLSGAYPEWSITRIAKTAPPVSNRAAAVAYNDCFVATTDGVISLAAVAAYGDFSLSTPSAALGRGFAGSVDSGAVMMRITSRDQLWFRPRRFDSSVWVFHPAVNAWTRFTFPEPIGAAVATDTDTCLAVGSNVCRMSDAAADDDGAPRQAIIAPKVIRGPRHVILHRMRLNTIPVSEGEAAVTFAGHGVPVPFATLADTAATDTDEAATDLDPLGAADVIDIDVRLNRRVPFLAPVITIERGRFSFAALSFDITEE